MLGAVNEMGGSPAPRKKKASPLPAGTPAPGAYSDSSRERTAITKKAAGFLGRVRSVYKGGDRRTEIATESEVSMAYGCANNAQGGRTRKALSLSLGANPAVKDRTTPADRMKKNLERIAVSRDRVSTSMTSTHGGRNDARWGSKAPEHQLDKVRIKEALNTHPVRTSGLQDRTTCPKDRMRKQLERFAVSGDQVPTAMTSGANPALQDRNTPADRMKKNLDHFSVYRDRVPTTMMSTHGGTNDARWSSKTPEHQKVQVKDPVRMPGASEVKTSMSILEHKKNAMEESDRRRLSCRSSVSSSYSSDPVRMLGASVMITSMSILEQKKNAMEESDRMRLSCRSSVSSSSSTVKHHQNRPPEKSSEEDVAFFFDDVDVNEQRKMMARFESGKNQSVETVDTLEMHDGETVDIVVTQGFTKQEVNCADCQRRFKVAHDCKVLYCPLCKTLTPII